MCMWDAKAARQAEAVLITDDEGLGGTSAQLAPANPNRMALMLGAGFEAASDTGTYCEYRSGGPTGAIIALLSPQSPMIVLHVAQVGQFVTGSVWARKAGTGNVTALASEVRWNLPLEQLV